MNSDIDKEDKPMPRKKMDSEAIEETKEKRPRKSRKEALTEKINTYEKRVDSFQKKLDEAKSKLADFKDQLELIDNKELQKQRSDEQKKIAKFIQEKGLSFEDLEALLKNKDEE